MDLAQGVCCTSRKADAGSTAKGDGALFAAGIYLGVVEGMAMSELVCVHEWSDFTIRGGVAPDLYEQRHCGRCQTYWRIDTPEPRVVLGRLE